MICVSLGDILYEDSLLAVAKTEMVEIRADLLRWPVEEYRDLILKSPRSLFTFRPGNIPEDERIYYYKQAIEAGTTYIDVEMEASPEFIHEIKKALKDTAVQLVLSYHNYELTPPQEKLKSILSSLYKSGADIAKIACMVNHPTDAAVLLSLYMEHGRKVVTGMGIKGKIVRLASEFLGGEFTYASLEAGRLTAPGQMTLEEMKGILETLKSGS